MASDLTWLQAAVVTFSHRPNLAAKMPEFVMLAEDRLGTDVEAYRQDSTAALTTVAGLETVDVPAGLIELKSMTIPGQGSVTYLSPGAFDARYSTGATGAPRHYTVVGSQVKLGPTPDAAYSLKCTVRLALTPLYQAPGGVNWLISEHPSAYLAATMCELHTYTNDAAELAKWEQKYATALSRVNGKDTGAASSLTVRPESNTP